GPDLVGVYWTGGVSLLIQVLGTVAVTDRGVAVARARMARGPPHRALGRDGSGGSGWVGRGEGAVGRVCDGGRMQQTDGVLRLSATDLTTHLACAHATTLDLEAA